MRDVIVDCATGETVEVDVPADEVAARLAEKAAAEVEASKLKPLDATGALAALLVVQGALELGDAANAVGLHPDQLVAEAQAWAVAAADTPI